MADSPTIVVARLDDEELQKSIKSMVTSFNQGLDDMKTHADSVVKSINESLKGIKGGSVSSGGVSDGGSTKRAKAYSEEGKQIEQNVERQKEYNATLDQTAAAIQKATSGKKKGIEYMSIPSDVDKELTYLINVNDKLGRQLGDAMQKEQAILDAKNKEILASQEAARAQQQVTNAVSGTAIAYGDVHKMAEQALGIKHNADGSKKKEATDAQYLREQLAALLDVEQREVTLTNTKQASYDELSAELKQLTAAYHRLGADIAKTEGADIAQRIQTIQREMQKFQQTMSRPVSWEAIDKLPTKTLDDIAYKMRQMQLYKSGLDLKEQSREIAEVNRAYDSLRRAQLKYMSDAQKLTGINAALGRSWNYMKNRLAFYFTVGASTAFVKELMRVRSEYEMNERALGVLINSAQRGTQIFQELSQMALVSPYTLIELSAAAKQLTAYDVAAKDVVDTTRRLADMASAVGVPIERLTYALGQIKAYGYLNSRDNRMFLNAGIPLVKQLANYYSDLEGKMVSTADVYDRIKKKAVDYNDVMQVLNRMTDEGGRFFDFQAKMAETLKVRLANLTLAWNNMLNDIGAETQGFLTWGIGALRTLFLHWKDVDAAIGAVVKTAIGGAVGLAAGGILSRIISACVQIKTGALTAKTAVDSLRTSWDKLAKSKVWENIKFGGWMLLLSAVTNAIWEVAVNFDSATKEMSRAVRENAEKTYSDLSDFLGSKELRRIITSLREGATERLSEENMSKAWEKVREEILLVSLAGEGYVQTLQEIEDVGERLQKGFGILEDVQTVAAVLKDMGDYGIAVQKDWSQFWNLWMLPDGLFENLRDYGRELDDVIEKYGSLEALRSQVYGQNGQRLYGTDAAKDYDNLATAQQRFNENLQTTITSIHKIISLNEGWSSDVGKINELYAQVAHNLALQGSLSPEETFKLQLAMEKERAKDVKEAIQIRFADETAALNRALDEQSKMRIRSNIETLRAELQDFDKYNGESKVYWNDFTKYIKERRISEAREMFKGLSAEEIQNLDFSKGKYKEWVDDMVRGYAKSHKMSYDEAFQYLHNWVRSANKWSIFIPLTISTEDGKTEMQILEEADAAYQQAQKEIERLTTRKKELEALGASSVGTSTIDKEYAKTLKEITQAEKDLEDARAKGGHGKDKSKGGSKKDPVLDALKTEIKLVEQLQGEYDKLTKGGASREEALGTIRGAFGNTIKQLNSQLRGYGLPELTTQLITGKDPNKALAHFKQTLQSLVDKGMMSLERSKEVEAIIEKLTISAKTYNLDKITKGLNSELDKLKEEYELAVELDANPELGGLFADWWDIDMEGLPRTAQAYAERATKLVNQYLSDNNAGLQLPLLTKITNDDLRSLRESVDADQFNAKWLEIIENAVKAARDVRQKEADEQIKNWNNLLQKYSEYEYKKAQIAKTANEERKTLVERFGTDEQKETAAKLVTQIDAVQDPSARAQLEQQLRDLVAQISKDNKMAFQLSVAIDNKKAREDANLDFTEFQKTGTWALASGDLTGMTKTALRGLIDSLEEYKKKAKNLDPKQIKQINRALKSLHSEVRRDSPFSSLADTMEQASLRAEDLQSDIDATQASIDKIINKFAETGVMTESDAESLENLTKEMHKLKKEQDAISKVSMKAVMGEVTKFTGAISGATSMVGDLAQAFGDTATAKAVKDIGTVMDKIGQGAALGGSIGGGWGALAGAIAGAGIGIVTALGDIISGNAEITSQVEDSERRVKRLENAYKELEYAIDKAYGTEKVGASQILILAKQMELAELKRQKRLEESRRSKHRDEERIIELKGQIIELQQEIEQTSDEIINDLLGISSVGDAVENLVSSMIEAFKQGEDYMKQYDESFAEMVDNMIMKAIASKVVGDAINKVWDELDKTMKERGEAYTKPMTATAMQLGAIQDGIAQGQEQFQNWLKEWQNANYILQSDTSAAAKSNAMEDMAVAEQKMREYELLLEILAQHEPLYEEQLKQLREAQKEAMQITPEDVQSVRDTAAEARDEAQRIFEEMMAAYGITFGQDKEGAQLSSLQAGIQGVTEETAGALEAYMNGVSQQVYLHSEYLRQIAERMQAFDPEVSLGVQSQMLLQLQNSYQVQQSILSVLQGWSSPTGNSMRVVIES